MELYDRFQWSNNNLNLRQFMDHYSHILPQVVLVTEGYAGRDDEMHQIGADEPEKCYELLEPTITEFLDPRLSTCEQYHEIYWVDKMLGQPRVLLQDKQKRCNSIPLDDISMFQLLKKDGQMTDNLPLQEALRQYRQNEDLIQFTGNQPVVISSGAEYSHKESLGLMTKLNEYDQKFLIVHDMSNDEILPQRSAIPLYVPITVEVAQDFNIPTAQMFQEFLNETARLVSKFKSTRIKLEKGILQFDKEPEGDYSYAEPLFRQAEEKDETSDTGAIQQTNANLMAQNDQIVTSDNKGKEEDLSSDDYEEINDDYVTLDECKMIPPRANVERSQSLENPPIIPPKAPHRRHYASASSSIKAANITPRRPKAPPPLPPTITGLPTLIQRVAPTTPIPADTKPVEQATPTPPIRRKRNVKPVKQAPTATPTARARDFQPVEQTTSTTAMSMARSPIKTLDNGPTKPMQQTTSTTTILQQTGPTPPTQQNKPTPTTPTQQTRLTTPTLQTGPTTPTQQTGPATPTQQTRQATPTQQTRPTTPTQKSRPTTPIQQTGTTTPTQQTRPTTPTQQTRPTTPTQQSRPTTLTQQTRQATQTQLTGPTTPIQQSGPTTPTQQTRPSTPTQQTRPTTPIQQTTQTPPIQQTTPTTPTQQTRPTTPTQQIRPTTPLPLQRAVNRTVATVKPNTSHIEAYDDISLSTQCQQMSNDPLHPASTSVDGESMGNTDETKQCNWTSAADVPLNITDFTIDQVECALKLIASDDVAALMSRQAVDGRLLAELDEDILIEDFNCTRFKARKIDQFIKGWRPKE